jgi:UDP-glucose 4-epimerase
MNILVTGGAGFIGSNIVDAYIEKGHNVIIADNLSTGRRQNINGKALFYEVDIRHDALEDIFRKEKIDIITHLAAQIDVRKSVTNPREDADINVLGGINVLSMAHKYGIKKIIYSSTGGAIYGEPRYLPCDENHPIRPMAGYGVSKHVLEHYIELYADLFKLDYTILRYANVYGPRQDPLGEAGVVAIFMGKMLQGETPVIFGNGKQTRDFVYVGDVVKANVLALTAGSGEIFNIATGVETSVLEIFAHLREIIAFKGEVIHEEERLGEVFRIYLDTKKAKDMLNWAPQITLHEGMKITVDYTKAIL